jgi:hypothetical protein
VKLDLPDLLVERVELELLVLLDLLVKLDLLVELVERVELDVWVIREQLDQLVQETKVLLVILVKQV